MEGIRPTKDLPIRGPLRPVFLPDAALRDFRSRMVYTSFSGGEEAEFLAAYGLGSPFPEVDVQALRCTDIRFGRLCRHPMPTRTFGFFVPFRGTLDSN
jgi:hypothetical protein